VLWAESAGSARAYWPTLLMQPALFIHLNDASILEFHCACEASEFALRLIFNDINYGTHFRIYSWPRLWSPFSSRFRSRSQPRSGSRPCPCPQPMSCSRCRHRIWLLNTGSVSGSDSGTVSGSVSGSISGPVYGTFLVSFRHVQFFSWPLLVCSWSASGPFSHQRLHPTVLWHCCKLWVLRPERTFDYIGYGGVRNAWLWKRVYAIIESKPSAVRQPHANVRDGYGNQCINFPEALPVCSKLRASRNGSANQRTS
jgi:hypothetical protein